MPFAEKFQAPSLIDSSGLYLPRKAERDFDRVFLPDRYRGFSPIDYRHKVYHSGFLKPGDWAFNISVALPAWNNSFESESFSISVKVSSRLRGETNPDFFYVEGVCLAGMPCNV